MKLYVSGVPVPKLGSFRDRVLRQYLSNEDALEVSRTSFDAFTTILLAEGKQGKDLISKKWDEHVAKQYGVFEEMAQKRLHEEVELSEQYEAIRDLRPVVSKDKKTGKLIVSGLESMQTP